MFSVLTPFSRTNIRYCFQHIPTFPVLIPSSFLKKEQWLKWKTPHDHHQSSIASIYFHYWLFSCGNPDIITTPFAIYPPDRKAWTLASLSQLHTINHVIKYGPNASPPTAPRQQEQDTLHLDVSVQSGGEGVSYRPPPS